MGQSRVVRGLLEVTLLRDAVNTKVAPRVPAGSDTEGRVVRSSPELAQALPLTRCPASRSP